MTRRRCLGVDQIDWLDGLRGRSERKLDADRSAGDFPYQLLDLVAEALTDPLQDESIRREEAHLPVGLLAMQRPDPGRKLLRGELALERGEANRPWSDRVERNSEAFFQGIKPGWRGSWAARLLE